MDANIYYMCAVSSKFPPKPLPTAEGRDMQTAAGTVEISVEVPKVKPALPKTPPTERYPTEVLGVYQQMSG